LRRFKTMSQTEPRSLEPADVEACLRVLKALAAEPTLLQQREEIERHVARVYKKARKERRRQSEHRRQQADRSTIARTGRIRLELPGAPIVPTSPGDPTEFSPLLARSRQCYICRQSYRDVHRFYHWLCPDCASFNDAKRQQVADLSGRRALVTGGRIKIGYQTALKLLRWGAEVTITTRFPNDALSRFQTEPDVDTWRDRLSVVQSDFRDVPRLLELIELLRDRLSSLDLLVNNAAQSVRKSPEMLDRLAQTEAEVNPIRLLNVFPSEQDGARPTPPPSSLVLDRHGEWADRRERHGWTQRLSDLEPVELLEVLLINSNAPCLLTSGLLPLFLRSPFPDRYVINVTGADGQFARRKNTRHPHINMSKAALNMMTRTSAPEFAGSGVYMNSVDTGWITHEGSWSRRMEMLERGFVPPLDEVDGAARILDPMVMGIQGNPTSGQLFRNYKVSNW
jgi:NAD(P)-dependent dehydrogenase (short-subunit alcohol dehydrogenase family)